MFLKSSSPKSGETSDRGRIALLLNSFPGVSQTFVMTQIAGLREAGFLVHVYSARSAGGSVQTEDRAFRTHATYADRQWLARLGSYSRLPGRIRSMAFRRSLRRIDRDALRRNDLVLCHFGPSGLRAARAAVTMRNPPPIWTIFHGYDVSKYVLEHGEDVYDLLFRTGSRFLAVSRLWADRLAQLGCPPDRIGLLRMGVDCKSIPFAMPSAKSDSPLRILSVGRLVEKKGIDFALWAAAQMARQAPQLAWSFDIIGEGPLEGQLRDLARELGIGDRVCFRGAQSSAQVMEQLRQSDVFLLPSVTAASGDMEGIPVALMEAMAAGVPVLSTHHSGIPELVEHGVSGLLAPERDIDELSEHLLRLLRDLGLRRSLAQAARAKVEAEFNQDRINLQLAGDIEAVHSR